MAVRCRRAWVSLSTLVPLSQRAFHAFVRLFGWPEKYVLAALRRMGPVVALNCVGLGANLAGAVIAAHVLGPSNRGVLAKAILGPAVASIIGGVGAIGNAITYHEARAGQGSGLAFSPWILGSQHAAILSLPSVLLSAVAADIESQDLLSVSFVTFFGTIAQYDLAVLRGRSRFSLTASLQAVIPVVSLALIVYLSLTTELSVGLVLAVYAAGNMVVAVLVRAAVASGRKGRAGRDRPMSENCVRQRAVLGLAFRGYFASLGENLNSRFDVLVVAALRSPRDAGLYAVAANCGAPLQVVGQALRLVILPRVAAETDVSSAQRLRRRIVRATVLAVAAATLVLVAFAPRLVPVAFGPAYRAAVPIAVVYICATGVLVVKDMLVGLALGSRRMGRASVAEVLGAITIIVLVLPALAVGGLVGAAIASLFAYAVAGIALIDWVRLPWQRPRSDGE